MKQGVAASAKNPAQAVPRMLGRYHVLEEVAPVPLGYSHLARYEGSNGFQRWSALLRVDERLAQDAEFRRAFFDSARRAVRIQHPNVALTLDVGETDGILWLAQDYLMAETAEDLLRAVQRLGVPVPWDIACRIITDCALGLEAIHELGPDRRLGAHRLAITYDGSTKIIEPCFPEAQIVSARDPRALPYTAPEILWEGSSDRRSDIYSLGVVLWELCVGRSLFAGNDEQETRALLEAHQVPPLRQVVSSVPPLVEELISKALKANPERRFDSAKAFARSLQAALVKEALIVTDDDVGRYLLSLFADRFQAKEDRLSSAAEVTEVFSRDGEEPRSGGMADTGDVSGPTQVFASPSAPTQIFAPASRSDPPAHSPAALSMLATHRDSGARPSGPPSRPPASRPPASRPPPQFPPPPPSSRLRVPPPPMTAPLDNGPVSSVPPFSVRSGPSERMQAAPSWPAQHQPPMPPGFGMARTMPLPTGPTAPFPLQNPISRSPLPPPMSARPNIPPAYIVTGGPGGSGRRPIVPAAETGPSQYSQEESRGMSPLLLFFVLAIAVAVLAVLVFVRFRGHDETAIPIPTAQKQPSASVPVVSGPPRASASASVAAAVDAGAKPAASASAVAVASSSSSSPTSASSSTPPASTSKATTTASTKRHTSKASSSTASEPPEEKETAPPPPPPSTSGSGKGQLTVVCVPACDEVLDGRAALGPSPIFKRPTSVGSHRITLKVHDPPSEKVVEVVVGPDEPTVIRQPMGR